MKQGTGNKTTVPRPSSQVSKVNLAAVSRMGAHEIVKKPPKMLTKTGVEAPTCKVSQHHCGSQGKHK